MGFSAALQGKAAHESFLLRQDAELRLLDLVRRCMHSKMRADRDYALALSAMVQQGLKVERAEDLAANVASLGYDLDGLVAEGRVWALLAVLPLAGADHRGKNAYALLALLHPAA